MRDFNTWIAYSVLKEAILNVIPRAKKVSTSTYDTSCPYVVSNLINNSTNLDIRRKKLEEVGKTD